jgi:hypothetical protein
LLKPPAVIREDFDRIARLSGDSWNHNTQYHPFLLRQLPSRMRAALDIGCGAGAFSRLVAVCADPARCIHPQASAVAVFDCVEEVRGMSRGSATEVILRRVEENHEGSAVR